jgi:hypothetical protein
LNLDERTIAISGQSLPILILRSYEINYPTRLFRNRISPAFKVDEPGRTEHSPGCWLKGKKIRLKKNKLDLSAALHRAIRKSTNYKLWPVISANSLIDGSTGKSSLPLSQIPIIPLKGKSR